MGVVLQAIVTPSTTDATASNIDDELSRDNEYLRSVFCFTRQKHLWMLQTAAPPCLLPGSPSTSLEKEYHSSLAMM